MSVEIKCDRCGGPAETIHQDSYSKRAAKDSILFTRDGEAKIVDLCEKCRDDLDIFLQGGMPGAKFKTGLEYLDLPNPLVCMENGFNNKIIITADVLPVERMVREGGVNLNQISIDSVMIGVKVK